MTYSDIYIQGLPWPDGGGLAFHQTSMRIGNMSSATSVNPLLPGNPRFPIFVGRDQMAYEIQQHDAFVICLFPCTCVMSFVPVEEPSGPWNGPGTTDTRAENAMRYSQVDEANRGAKKKDVINRSICPMRLFLTSFVVFPLKLRLTLLFDVLIY